jgi:hypothetical protein
VLAMKKEEIVWQIITQLIQYHSALHPEAKTIKPEDRIETYYPTKKEELIKPFNEHANRFGETILDTLENINIIFELETKLKYDFGFREEWDLFETVGQYQKYMVRMISERDKIFKI